jgi:hypothetical protein
MAGQEAIDWGAMGIDPNDLKRRAEATPAKKSWRRQFIKFPWAWMDRLVATKRATTYRLALVLVYEHWRTGGRAIVLSNTIVRREGISRRSKWNALAELEQMGLIAVEKRRRRSPRVSLLELAGP